MPLYPRHTIPGFIERTQKNLQAIRSQPERMPHPVTQLVCSMLGLVVFPWANYEENSEESELLPATLAQQFAKKLKEQLSKSLKELEQQHGWPHWDFELDDASEKTTTLEVLVKHLRNAVSHYRVGFDSDSKDLYEVTITFQDKPWGKGKPINWRTTIRADELLTFCNKLAACTLKIAEDVLG